MASWLALPLAGLAGLLVAGNGAIHAFPGAQKIEAAIVLHQLYRLVDHALQLVVVSELDEASQRKVLAQRMALKAVIGEQAPEVGVVFEQDPVEIVGFALEPVGCRKQRDDAWHRRLRAGPDPHANPMIEPRAQQVIDDIEALIPLGIVDATNVDQAAEAARLVIAQELNRFAN